MSSLITFGLAVGSVCLWTLRVATTARGCRALGSVVAATEAVVFLLAFSHVTGSLDAPIQVLVYGGGVGIGTYVGLTIDRTIRTRGQLRSYGQSDAQMASAVVIKPRR